MPDSTGLLFISRAAADHEFAAKIARDLEVAGYQTLLQQWDFANSSFIERMHSALADGARVIALLSPEYLQSDYCSAEWQSVLAHDPLNRNSRLLVLRVAPCAPTGLLAPLGYWDLVPIADQPESIRDVVLAAVKKKRWKNESTSETPYWRPPKTILHRNIHSGHGLIERPALLSAIESLLHSSENDRSGTGAICAVTGLPGVGKTVLVREFAYLNQDRYTGVWWIDARISSSIVEGLVVLGSHFIRGLQDVANQSEAAKTTLQLIEDGQFERPWLLIFDGANDPEEISDFLPHSGAHVLITSQWADWHEWAVELVVDVLDRDSSMALLLERAHRLAENATAADLLAEALGDLPLALNHAAAYCRATGTSFEEYRNELLQLITRKPTSTRYSNSVSVALQLAISRATDRCHFTSLLISLLGCLSPGSIPIELLDTAFEQVAERDDTREAIAALSTFSLIEVTESPQGAEVNLHGLVQQVMRIQLRNENSEDQAVGLTTLVLAKNFPHSSETAPDQDPRNPSTWAACARLLPHTLAVLEKPSRLPAAAGPTSFLMHHVGLYLHSRGLYAAAEPLLRGSLGIKEATAGPDDACLLPDLRRLGILLMDRGKLSEAEALLKRSLALAQRELGAEHPATGTDLANLAVVLEKRGEFGEAESLYRHALELTEGAYGSDYYRTKTQLSNLALLLQKLGRTEEVEEILREYSEQGGAPTSLSTLLLSTGRLTEAEQLLQQSLAEHEMAFGPDHPEVARDLSNLSVVLFNTGRFDQAESALRRALEIEEQTIGYDHPRIAVRLGNLAALYAKTGQPHQATQACLRALSIINEVNEVDRGPEIDQLIEHLHSIMLDTIKEPLLESLGLESLSPLITLVSNPEDAERLFEENLKLIDSEDSEESTAEENLRASEIQPEAPLLAAASLGDSEAVSDLLNEGVDLHVQTSGGYTALHLAARAGHVEIIHKLINAGADIHAGSRTTALHLAAARGREECAMALIDHGAEAEDRTDEGATPLHFAALEDRSAMLSTLAAFGADLEARDQDGWTALHFAVAGKAEGAVQTLLALGADPFAAANDGCLALHMAAKEGQELIVEALLDSGLDVDTPIPTGHTALHLAAERGHEATVRCLIRRKASLSVQTNGGTTPLHFAAFNGHLEVANLLLATGADIAATTSAGYTPLDLAANRNHTLVVQLLLEAGDASADQSHPAR
jgi:ankyrin repeat protein/Flp pilus assembly protein TadD